MTRRRLTLLGASAVASRLLGGGWKGERSTGSRTATANENSRLVLPFVGQGYPSASGAESVPGQGRSRLILPFVPSTGAPRVAPSAARGQPSRPAASAPLPTPERLPIQRQTKWGLGVYREGHQIFDDLYTARPGVILLMDPSDGWARRIRACFPRAFVAGRRYVNEASQPLDEPEARGTAFADAVARTAVPLRNVVDAWMSYNEVTSHGGIEDYRRYNRFQVAFARRLQDEHGVAAVAGNDGSGAVEPEDYPRYFAEAIRASRYFGVHAYSPPATRSMHEAAEWNALRYRKIHDALERSGVGGVRMVITESGLGNGWRGYTTEEAMAAEYAWFTAELEKDAYMIGHAAYGVFGNDDRWRAFDLRGTKLLATLGS